MAQEVIDAKANATTARDRLQQLEDAVRGGDTSVTAAQLMEAREAARLAELQVDGARTTARQANRDELNQAARELRDEVRSTSLPDLTADVDGLISAVERLSGAVRARNDMLGTWTRRAGDLAAQDALDASMTVVRDGFTVDGRTFRPLTTAAILTRILRANGRNSIVPRDDARDQLKKITDSLAGVGITPVVHESLSIEQHHQRMEAKLGASQAHGVVRQELNAEEHDAVRAAELRARRDGIGDTPGQPYDANRPGVGYPEWIDDPDLVARVPDLYTLEVMRANWRQGKGFTTTPTEQQFVSVSGVKKTEAVFSDGAPIVNGKAVLSDTPL